jgi:hypothetical protein
MATLASLTARLEKLEQKLTAKRFHILFVNPGEDVEESIARQKREKGVRSDDSVIVLQWVAPPVHDE